MTLNLKTGLTRSAVAAVVALGITAGTASAETLKIGFIDPLSGASAQTGDIELKHWKFAADKMNEAGGIGGMDVEFVAFDNKGDPKETLVQYQKAVDQGIHFVAQGVGSSVSAALTGAVLKNNERNPGEETIFFNIGGIDPSLTNDNCNFWHFAFDQNVDVKMEGLTNYIETLPDIKSVYIIAQDYSFGKSFIAAAEKMLAEKRPDIKIVGSELHPVAKVKDFTPYVQKIMSSGAEAVLTGNWGSDMTLLIKAAAAAGQEVPYFTYYGGAIGAPSAMGKSALGLVTQISDFHENADASPEQLAKQDEFEAKYPDTDYYYERTFTVLGMLKNAVEKAGGIHMIEVAKALEGMTYEGPFGTVTMRADDHQLLAPLFVSTFSDDVKRDVEKTGFGFKTDMLVTAESTAAPTTCQMVRPE